MNTREGKRIAWLDVLRVAGIFAVIVMHVAAPLLSDRRDLGHAHWWTWAVLDAAVLWCVPIFVMISGAVLLPNERQESCIQFYRRRAMRLLVPLCSWTLVYSVLRYLRGSEGDSVGEILMSIFQGRPYGHMWFLYMIVLLAVFTPMLRTFVAAASDRERRLLMVLCIVLATLDSLYTRVYSPIGHSSLREFVPFFGYYLCGYEIARSVRGGPPRGVLVLLIAAAVGAVAVVPYALLRHDAGAGHVMFLSCYQSPVVLLMSVCVFLLAKTFATSAERLARLLDGRVLRDAAASVLGIYLVHPLLIRALRELGVSGSIVHPAVGVPLVSLVVFVGAWGFIAVVRRIPWVRRTVS